MNKFWKRLKQVGPGAVVAAAFIGPGTITTCTTSGASYGYTLLWALLFSTISVIVLQSMASKLGIVKGKGLGEALREKYTNKTVSILLAILVIAAVFVGNVAYETGNVTGGMMGLQAFINVPSAVLAIIVFIIAGGLLISGKYSVIEKFLTALVVLMGVLFLVTSIAVKPNWGEVFKGLFVPSVPEGNRPWFIVAGLMGTTVVPYNIYLHASSSAKKWGAEGDKDEAVTTSLTDSIVSIGLGGIISMAVVVTAKAAMDSGLMPAVPTNGKEMAQGLTPVLGSWATVTFGIGLFAAGMSSAITAPLAAAFASAGILGWGENMKKKRFIAIWAIVLCFGLIATLTLGKSPTEIIMFAQAANAFLLPITAILLMLVCNDKQYMGKYKNGVVLNILGVIVICVAIFIAVRNFDAFVTSFKNLVAANKGV